MEGPTPLIKGVFVNSHIKAVRMQKGDEGVKLLEERYGGSLAFKNLDDVPVREEVKIIELALDMLNPEVSKDRRAFEAGRLHFRNFSQTPLGRIMFTTLPKDFKMFMMRAKYIAQHVFKNVIFTPVDLGPNEVRVIMENNDYPLEHFQGLFQEWMEYLGYIGQVRAEAPSPTRYEYTMTWR